MAKSIIQDGKYCMRCGTTQNLHLHHIFAEPFRKKADQYGLTCFLCFDHHVGNHGVHNTTEGHEYWTKLKKLAQEEFERRYSHELFMEEFKRNYIEDGDEKYEPRSERIQCLLYPTTYDKLKKRAKAEGTSMNEVANRAIEDFLKSIGKL